MVYKWLKIRHADQVASNQATPSTLTELNDITVDTLLDDAVIDNIFAGDIEDYCDSLDDFMQLSLPQLNAMAQMHKEAFDLAMMKDLAHKLKSSAMTLGVNKVGEICQYIEQVAKQGQQAQVVQALQQLEQVLPKVEAEIVKILASRSV